MRNLAEDCRCDETIKRELRVARVDAVRVPMHVGEVPYSVEGRLGRFTFRRAWCYWVVAGPLPLEAADRLYADPCGRTDVRVNGHCGCPAPEGSHVTWRGEGGVQVLPTRERDQCEQFLQSGSELMRETARKILAENRFHDDPASIGCRGFVELYHVDSELGLRLLADEIRRAEGLPT